MNFVVGQDSATFESALDWLCFNLPGDELPLKFASAAASSSRAGIGLEGSGFCALKWRLVRNQAHLCELPCARPHRCISYA